MLKREAERFGEPPPPATAAGGGGEGCPMSVTDLSKAWENIHKAKSALRHIENRLEAVNAGTNLLDLPVYQKPSSKPARKIPRAGAERRTAVDASASVTKEAWAAPHLRPLRDPPLENGVSPTRVDSAKTSRFPRPRERHKQPGLTRSQLEARWLLSEQTRAETEAASERSRRVYSRDRRDAHSADFASAGPSAADDETDVRVLNDAVALDLLEGGRALPLNGFSRHHHHHEAEAQEEEDKRGLADRRNAAVPPGKAPPRGYDRSPPQRLARDATPAAFPPNWMECNGYSRHRPAAAATPTAGDLHAVAAANRTGRGADGISGSGSPKPGEKLLRLKERAGRRAAHAELGRRSNGEGPSGDGHPSADVDDADATRGRDPTGRSGVHLLNNGLTQAPASSRAAGTSGRHGKNQFLAVEDDRSWSAAGSRAARVATYRPREAGGPGDPVRAAELSVRLLSEEVRGILDDLQLDACIGAFEKNPAAAAPAAVRTWPAQAVPARLPVRDGAPDSRDAGWMPTAGAYIGAAATRGSDGRQQPDRHKRRADERRASRRPPEPRGEPALLHAPPHHHHQHQHHHHHQQQLQQLRSASGQPGGMDASSGGGVGSWDEDRHRLGPLGRATAVQAQYRRLAQPSGESDKENRRSRFSCTANAGDFLNNGRVANPSSQPHGRRPPDAAERPSCSCGSRLDNPSPPALVGASSPDSDFYRCPPYLAGHAFEPTERRLHHLLADADDDDARRRKLDRIESLKATAARLASRLEEEAQTLAAGGGGNRSGHLEPPGADRFDRPPKNHDPGRRNYDAGPRYGTSPGEDELMRKLELILGKDSSLRKSAREEPAPRPRSSGKNDSGAAGRSPREESYLHALDAVGRSVEKLRSQKRKLSERCLSPRRFSPNESGSPAPGEEVAALPAVLPAAPAPARTEQLLGPTRNADGAAANNEHRQRPADLLTPGGRRLRDAETGGSPASPTSGRRSPCATTTSLSSLSPASSSSHKSLSNGSREEDAAGDGDGATAYTTVLAALAGLRDTPAGAAHPHEPEATITELLDEHRHRDSEFLRKLRAEEPPGGTGDGSGGSGSTAASSPAGIAPREAAPAGATPDTASTAVAPTRSPTTSVPMTLEEFHSPRRHGDATAPASPPAGAKIAGKKGPEQRARTPDSDSTSRCSSSSGSILDKLKKFQGRLDERYLTKREQRLRERRRRAKELLLWKQRLDTEEEEVRNMERLAAQAGRDTERGRRNGRLRAPPGAALLADSQRDVLLTVSSSPTLTPRDSSIRSIVSNADTERGNHGDKAWRATDNLSEWSLSIRTASESECSSEVEGRIVALRDELARRKMMVERLQKEQRRRARERLRAHESSLRLQLQAYDTFICKAQGELENSTEPQPSLRQHSRTPVSLDLDMKPAKGTSGEAETTELQEAVPDEGSLSSAALSETKHSSAPSDDASERSSSLREETSGSLPARGAATRRDETPSPHAQPPTPAPRDHDDSTFTAAEPSSGDRVRVPAAETSIPSPLLDDDVDPSDTRAVLKAEDWRDQPPSGRLAANSEAAARDTASASLASKDGDIRIPLQTPDSFSGESERVSQPTEHRDDHDDEMKTMAEEGADMPPCWEVQDLVQIGAAETRGGEATSTSGSRGGDSAAPEAAGGGFGGVITEPLVNFPGFVADELPGIVVHATASQTWESIASGDGARASNGPGVLPESWSADFWQDRRWAATDIILPDAGPTADPALRGVADDAKIGWKAASAGDLSDSDEFEFSSNFSSAEASDISSLLTRSTSTFGSVSSPKGHDANLPFDEGESGETATSGREVDADTGTLRRLAPRLPSQETGEDEAPAPLQPAPAQPGAASRDRDGPLAGLQLGEQLLAAVAKFVDGVISAALEQVSEAAVAEAAASHEDEAARIISGARVERREADAPAAKTEAAAPQDAGALGVPAGVPAAATYPDAGDRGDDSDNGDSGDSDSDDDDRTMYSRLSAPDDSKGSPSGSASRRTSVGSVVSFSDADEGAQQQPPAPAASWLAAYCAPDDHRSPHTPLLDMLAREKGRMQAQRADGAASGDAAAEQPQWRRHEEDRRRQQEDEQQELRQQEERRELQERKQRQQEEEEARLKQQELQLQKQRQEEEERQMQQELLEQKQRQQEEAAARQNQQERQKQEEMQQKQQELQEQKQRQEEAERQRQQELLEQNQRQQEEERQKEQQQQLQQEEQRRQQQQPSNEHKANGAHTVANGLVGRFVSEALEQYLQLRQARDDKVARANTLLEPATPSQPQPPRLANGFVGNEEDSVAPESGAAQSGAEQRDAGAGSMLGRVEPEEVDFETERAFPPEPTARPVSPECDLDSSEDLSTPLAQLRLNHALLEAGLLQDDQDWFDEDFGLSSNRRALQQQQQQSPRTARFGEGGRPGSSEPAASPDARADEEEAARRPAAPEPEEEEEEALFAVPHSRPEVTALVSTALSELDKLTELGESARHVAAPRSYLGSDCRGQDIESVSRRVYKQSVFDLTKEVFMELHADDPNTDRPPWMKPRRGSSLYLWRIGAVHSDGEIAALIQTEVLRSLGLFEGSAAGDANPAGAGVGGRKPDLPRAVKWGKKSRDRVDIILARDLHEEEPQWVSYEDDELEVKMQAVDSIFEALLADTAHTLSQIYDNRAHRAAAATSATAR